MPIDWVQKTAELREKIKKNRESERNKAMKKTWAGSPEERNGDYCIRGRIKLGEIIVDAYQRGTPTRKEVGDLVKVWNERGAANVILSLRDDDPQYYCIDGQRRVAAAREIHGRDGDIEALVWLGLTAQEEAELFELYQRRKDLTPLDVFHSKLFREEPEAVVVNAIITNLGLRFGHPVDGDMSRIAAVGAVIQAYQKYGVTEVRELLRLLRDGFRQFTVPKANSISRMAIGGMGQFLARYPNCDRERVVEILGNNILDSAPESSHDEGVGSRVWLPKGLEFLSGLPTPERKRRLLMPMQAYVDDSGGKGQGNWLTLVGIVAKAEEWAAFSDLWRSLLDIPPAVSAWHMKDAAHFEREFSGWGRAERDARLWLLTNAVNDFNITALHCSVDLKAHKEFMAPIGDLRAPRKSKAARLGKILHEPYWLCFHSMIMAVCYELVDQETRDRFEIIFDEQSILGPRVKVWYPVIRSLMEPHEQQIMPIEPMFQDDTKFVPLQCADILAWLVHRELNDQEHTFGWIPNAMNGLVWSGHRQIFDRDRLKGIREKAIRESISAETYQEYSELLGL